MSWRLSQNRCGPGTPRLGFAFLVDRIQHRDLIRRLPKFIRKVARCVVMLAHHKHRATHPVGLGSRPSGPISRLLGASSPLADGPASPGGPFPAEKPGYRIVWGPYVRFYPPGGVAEWLKAHAWKACIRATVSRVRIPLPPPIIPLNHPLLTQHSLQLVVEHRYLTYASLCRLIEAHQ